MEGSVVDVKTTEVDQSSASGKQQDGLESNQFEPKEATENEEGEVKHEDKSTVESSEVPGENAEEGDDLVEMTAEVLAALEREKKNKKREQLRLAREKLDRHYKAAEPEIMPEIKKEPKKKKELETEAGDEEFNEDIDEEDEERPSKSVSKSSQASIGEVETMAQLKDSLVLSDTEEIKTGVSSSEEEFDDRGSVKVSFKEDFLNYFVLPSISDLTSESSEVDALESLRTTLQQSLPPEERDVGKFVNALTGETETSSYQAAEEDKVPIIEELEEEEESSSSISFDWPFDIDDDVPIAPITVDTADMAMELFFEANQSISHMREESTTGKELERAAREVRNICFDFLTRVIDEAVNTAEYVDPIAELRSKLDKEKLMDEMIKLYVQYLSTKCYNTDVNNKLYEYYRRVGQLRCFDRLSSKVEQIEYKRYMDAIQKLDYLHKKTDETKKTNSALLSSVRMDLEYSHNIALVSVETLENRIRETIVRKDDEFLPRIVENELRRMNTMRNEVSDSRLWLITRQHTLGSLVERKRNFDQITEDLTMDQFLVTQREVTALGTKVEERNHELNRMRDRCTRHMHQLAFIREKTSMTMATLVNNRLELGRKLEQQAELRAQLLKLKIQHSNLKTQKAKLQEECGLLFKPALLHDYDRTVEHIDIKGKKVKKLRKTVAELESRIEVIEMQSRDSDASILRQSKLDNLTRKKKI